MSQELHQSVAEYWNWYVVHRFGPGFAIVLGSLLGLSAATGSGLFSGRIGYELWLLVIGSVFGALLWEVLRYRPGVIGS